MTTRPRGGTALFAQERAALLAILGHEAPHLLPRVDALVVWDRTFTYAGSFTDFVFPEGGSGGPMIRRGNTAFGLIGDHPALIRFELLVDGGHPTQLEMFTNDMYDWPGRDNVLTVSYDLLTGNPRLDRVVPSGIRDRFLQDPLPSGDGAPASVQPSARPLDRRLAFPPEPPCATTFP